MDSDRNNQVQQDELPETGYIWVNYISVAGSHYINGICYDANRFTLDEAIEDWTERKRCQKNMILD